MIQSQRLRELLPNAVADQYLKAYLLLKYLEALH